MAVLATFDGQALPDLPLGITLNTVLAFLVTLTKALFMLAVTESIGQLKWNLFHEQDRPLLDMQLYDDASRGIRGSILLLFRHRWRSLANVGTVVCILGIVTSPLTQQLIAYPTRLSPSSHPASVPAIQQWNTSDLYWDASRAAIITAVANGALASVADPISHISPTCPTSNCTFPTFYSLGICTAVADVTSLLEVREIQDPAPYDLTVVLSDESLPGWTAYNSTIPGAAGIELISQDPFALAALHLPADGSLAFGNDTSMMRTAVYDFVVLFQTPQDTDFSDPTVFVDSTPVTQTAYEAVFHLCVREFDVSVSDGVVTVDQASVSYDVVPQPSQPPIALMNCSLINNMTGSDYQVCTDRLGDGSTQEENLQRFLYLGNPEKPDATSTDDLFGATIGALETLSQELAGDTYCLFSQNGARADMDYQIISECSYAGFQLMQIAWGHDTQASRLLKVEMLADNMAVSLTNM